MNDVNTEIRDEIQSYLADCYNQMPIVNELVSNTLSRERIREIVMLHYAETKTFTNVKNPARLYLCPHEARHAKKYFCYLYEEEQGNFQEGMNHADLFKPVCYGFGLTDEQLENCYSIYSRSWLYLFHEKPSTEIMVRELGVSVAWESLTPFFGDKLINSLRDNYGLSPEALKYFKVHHVVDQAHSVRAVDTLTYYCTTPELMKIAKKAIRTALIDELHLLRPYGSIL